MPMALPEGVRLFSIESTPPQPWKNGGGVTRPVAAKLDGDSVVWRISIADIEAQGDFSLFPDIERISVLMAGAGLRLCGEQTDIHFPDIGSQAAYPGDLPVRARLATGPARLLNVMTRRGLARADVHVHQAGWRQDGPGAASRGRSGGWRRR